MKKIMILLCITNVLHGAAPKPSSEVEQLKQELENTRQSLDRTKELLDDTLRELNSVWSTVHEGRDIATIDDRHYEKLITLRNKNSGLKDSMPWAPVESESQKAWNTIQKFMERYDRTENPHITNIWNLWGESEWKTKEDIISSTKHGEGTIWKINPEIGNFLVTYMGDYTTNPKRIDFVSRVGKVVPSLFGHGIPSSQATLKKLIEEIAKISPVVGKALQEQFNKRFKTTITPAVAQPLRRTAGSAAR